MSDIPIFTDNTIVSVRNISKSFQKAGDTIQVLENISLDVCAGDDISIIGQSGSGKSTLLQIIGALDTPTQGNLWMRTKKGQMQDVFTLSPPYIDSIRNQQVGFIFQFHHLLPDHTAVGNVAMPLIIAGESTTQAHAKAQYMLDRVGLAHRLRHKPGELSGGEQQRVAIARALVHTPQLVLADEPTGNLDPKTAESIMQLLVDLRSDVVGALIMVTHDHRLAEACSKKMQLRTGGLEAWT